MPRSPELRNLLDRTIAQLDNLKGAGVPATDRKIELFFDSSFLWGYAGEMWVPW